MATYCVLDTGYKRVLDAIRWLKSPRPPVRRILLLLGCNLGDPNLREPEARYHRYRNFPK
jgi:hypothetical protein